MFNYVKVVDGIVKSTQSSPNKVISPDLILINGELPAINSRYENDVFLAPIIREITSDAMRDRFTFEERVAIKSSADMRVQTFYDDLSLRKKPVNLDSPRFKLAMDLLLSEKLIEVGRDIVLLQNATSEEVR